MKRFLCALIALVIVSFALVDTSALVMEEVEEAAKQELLHRFSDLVSETTIEEHGLTERLVEKEEDSLNTLIYRKNTGENVAFVYGNDVKYTDADGKIQDKQKNITRKSLLKSNEYHTTDNDIISDFSINDAGNVEVKTTYNGYSMTSTIQKRDASKIQSETIDDERLVYHNAIDKGIHLMYEAEYNGVKEYIVMEKAGEGVFEFQIQTNGLTPVVTGQNGIDLYNEQSEVVLTIPPIYVEDSAETKNYTENNQMELISAGQDTYTLRVTVDSTFLSDSNTVSPLLIYSNTSAILAAEYIEEVYVDAAYPNQNFNSEVATSGQLRVGNRWGVQSNAYIRFDIEPGSIPYYNVLSAYYETYEISNTTDCVLVDVYPCLDFWMPSTITWNNQPAYFNETMGKEAVGDNMSAQTPEYGARGKYRFFISNLVRGWLQGLPNYGVVLKTNYETGQVCLATGDNTSYTACLVIIFVEDTYELESDLSVPNQNMLFYIKNKHSGKYLTVESLSSSGNVFQSDFVGNHTQMWRLVAVGNGYYQVKLNGTNYVLDVYCGGGELSGNVNNANIQTYPTGIGDNQKWKLVRNWNGTYKIVSKLSSDIKGIVVRSASLDSEANCILYTHNVNFTHNDDWTLEPVSITNADLFYFNNLGNNCVNGKEEMLHASAFFTTMMRIACTLHENQSAEDGLNALTSTNIWYFRGHGNHSQLAFREGEEGDTEYISSYIAAHESQAIANVESSFISSLNSNALRNLYLFGANCCLAGDSVDTAENATDLIGMLYRKGAHFVFSSPRVTHTPQNKKWCMEFIDRLAEGCSFYEAMQKAEKATIEAAAEVNYDHVRMAIRSCARHYAGDGSIILYHTPNQN